MKLDLNFIKNNILLFIIPLFAVFYCVYSRKCNLDMIKNGKPILPENDQELALGKAQHAFDEIKSMFS